MADVTISSLPIGTPSGTGVIPYSDGATTTKVTVDQINSLVSGVPVGTIIMWPLATPPAGYLECNGTNISRTTYASLFAALGTVYGVGDGSTTFALPDYRGRFLRGWDHGAAVDPDRATRTNRGDGITGDNVGTKQADALQNITGAIGGVYGAADQAYDWAFRPGANGAFDVPYNQAPYNRYAGVYYPPAGCGTEATFDASRVARTSTETRPTNINIMFCIKI